MNTDEMALQIEKLSPKDGDILLVRLPDVLDGHSYPTHFPLGEELSARGVMPLILHGDIRLEVLTTEELARIGLQRIPPSA